MLSLLRASYWPVDMVLVLLLSLGLLVSLLVGFGLMRLSATRPTLARALGWLSVVVGFSSYVLLSEAEPPGVRMLLIIGIVLFTMKGVVAVESVRTEGLSLTLGEWLSWSGGWPGMDPRLFSAAARSELADAEGAGVFLFRGLIRLGIGVVLMVCAHLLYAHTASLVLATAFALPGISLVLHFGIFQLLCAFWRSRGVPVYTLFPAPLRSHTLGEFWGRRWNLPFTEMIQRAVYRPLRPLLGRHAAALCGFGCSGLLHECAISVPVGRGYGLPMVYFVLHGGLVALERGTGLGTWLQGQPVWARVWTLFWLAAPMPILFHPPFLRGIVWPLAGMDVP